MISRYDHYCRGDISKIENYDKAIADTKTVWHCHHRLETHDENGNRRQGELHTTLKSGGFLFSLQRLNLHNQLTSN